MESSLECVHAFLVLLLCLQTKVKLACETFQAPLDMALGVSQTLCLLACPYFHYKLCLWSLSPAFPS